MDLFGEYLRYAGGRIRLGEMSTLLAVFGVEPATTRVTLSRLKRDGWFTTQREGRGSVYSLSDPMLSVLAEGRERIFTREDSEWDGWWTQVLYQVPESARNDREALRKQLTWLGFGQLATSTWVSPHSMVDRLSKVKDGFPDARIDVLRSRTTSITSDQALTATCWALDELADDCVEFINEYSALDGALDDLSDADALRKRTSMVADMRRLTFRDPQLPVELQPRDWPGRDAFELFRRIHSGLARPAENFVEFVIGRELDKPDP